MSVCSSRSGQAANGEREVGGDEGRRRAQVGLTASNAISGQVLFHRRHETQPFVEEPMFDCDDRKVWGRR